MSGQTCMPATVQRFSPDGPEPTGQSLNLEAQCDSFDGDRTPLNMEWITEELLARTQDVWGRYLQRHVSKEEAMEMLTNIKRIADAFLCDCDDGNGDEE